MRSAIFGVVLLFGTQSAAAAEPLVVDPWLERAPPPAVIVAAFEPFFEIVDPWADSTLGALYATDEIVDPWATPTIPTARFPLFE